MSLTCFLSSTGHAEDKPKLTPLQEKVILHGGTERPFDNAYWNHKEPGIYVDVLSGKPLFSSTDKFDSGTGWPSFTRPISDHFVTTLPDDSHGMQRTEVKAASGAHLGHVFDDGPKNQGGKRFCINSASLRFIHKDQLAEQGYSEYMTLFDTPSATTRKD